MLTKRTVFSVAIVLCVAGTAFGVKPGGGSTTGVVDKVFISNGDGQQILVVDTNTGEVAVILEKEGLFFEGMTFGPDGYLYACAPAQGKIIRFFPSDSPPADPTTVPVEFVYEAGEGDALQNPQCGEFTHNGDLLVTNKNVAVAGGYAVWMFPSDGPFNVPLALSSIPQELPETLAGVGRYEGVTQASNGDLRYVDFTNGLVVSLSIYVNPLTGVLSFVPEPAIPDISSLVGPIGIDSSSRDDVFVAADGLLLGYQYDKDMGAWSTSPCSLELTNERPNFMDFATTQTASFEDVVFVGTKGKNSGKLHEVVVDSDGACEIATSFSVKKPISNANQIVGVAVPRGDRAGKLVVTNPDEPENLFFNLFDHAYRLKPIQGCTVSVTAKDTLPTAICERIRQIEGKDTNLTDPCARYPDDPEGIEFDPVIYLGEDTAQMYDIIATGECDPGEYGINHILSSFTQKLRTPRIGFCSYESEEVCLNVWGLSNWDGARCCGLTELNFITPNDGSIPRDGSIGGFGPRLSEWFLVDDQYHIPDYNACMCPVSPLPEDSVPVFSAGSTIPLRVQLLINEDENGDPVVDCTDPVALEQACQAGSAGDFVTDPDTKVLLSIAYVEGGTFEPVTIEAGGNDQVQPPYFSPPNSVNASSYTYQLKAPAGFTGLYKVVIFVVNRDLEYPQLGFVERYMNIE